jgi:hypothetical protein
MDHGVDPTERRDEGLLVVESAADRLDRVESGERRAMNESADPDRRMLRGHRAKKAPAHEAGSTGDERDSDYRHSVRKR